MLRLQLGNEPQIEPAGSGAFHEAPFRSEPRPADERDLVPKQPMLVFDRQAACSLEPRR